MPEVSQTSAGSNPQRAVRGLAHCSLIDVVPDQPALLGQMTPAFAVPNDQAQVGSQPNPSAAVDQDGQGQERTQFGRQLQLPGLQPIAARRQPPCASLCVDNPQPSIFGTGQCNQISALLWHSFNRWCNPLAFLETQQPASGHKPVSSVRRLTACHSTSGIPCQRCDGGDSAQDGVRRSSLPAR